MRRGSRGQEEYLPEMFFKAPSLERRLRDDKRLTEKPGGDLGEGLNAGWEKTLMV